MANRRVRGDRLIAAGSEYTGYTVRDRYGERIGKVEGLNTNGSNQPEFFWVRTGFFNKRSLPIPVDAATVDKGRGFITVSQPKSRIISGPAFEDEELTVERKERVRHHYGLR